MNAAGAGAVSDEVTATPVAAPAQPAGLRATAGDAQVTLAWSALEDSSVTHWHYQQRAGRGSYGAWQRIPNSAADTTSHTVRGLVNGTPYSFRVRAVNAAGAGAVSDEVTATPVAAPAQPAGLRATAGDAQVTLAWSALEDSSVTHWHYQQRAGSGSYGAWQRIPNSAADTTSHTVRGLVNPRDSRILLFSVEYSCDSFLVCVGLPGPCSAITPGGAGILPPMFIRHPHPPYQWILFPPVHSTRAGEVRSVPLSAASLR